MPKRNKVTVQWRDMFNGGLPQSIVIQYRRRDVQYWNTIPVSDPMTHTRSIDGLTPGTEYFIRMYSKNIKGASNMTDEKLIKTGKYHYEEGRVLHITQQTIKLKLGRQKERLVYACVIFTIFRNAKKKAYSSGSSYEIVTHILNYLLV